MAQSGNSQNQLDRRAFIGAGVAADFGVYVSGDWTVADQAAKNQFIYSRINFGVADVLPRNILGNGGAGAVSAPNFWRTIWEDAGEANTHARKSKQASMRNAHGLISAGEKQRHNDFSVT